MEWNSERPKRKETGNGSIRKTKDEVTVHTATFQE
jgi:hypothetical protein